MTEITKKNDGTKKVTLQAMKVTKNSFLDRTWRAIAVSMVIGFCMLGQAPQAVADVQNDDQLITHEPQEISIAPANLLCLGLANLTICDTFSLCGTFCLYNNNPA